MITTNVRETSVKTQHSSFQRTKFIIYYVQYKEKFGTDIIHKNIKLKSL